MSGTDPKTRPKPGPFLPTPESSPLPPASWAKKTGFRPKFSGETNASDSGQISPLPPRPSREPRTPQPDLEAGRPAPAPAAPQPVPAGAAAVVNGTEAVVAPVRKRRDSDGGSGGKRKEPSSTSVHGAANGNSEAPRRVTRNEEVIEVLPEEDGTNGRHSHMKYELRDTPGLVPIGFYGLQHYFSMLGSLLLIPLVIVPAMGGSQEDTSNVVSTVLFISGVTTLLHTSFGSRLPLIQGPSFVYLAPALAIINSPEFQGLNGNNFKHIMKRLQGAVIIASAFQTILGYSGLMSIILRLINPVILLVIVFSLYLRKISVFGHRIFLIYAVPLALGITWAFAFLLTETGAYDYKGCSSSIPASNIISASCRKRISRVKYCRVDTSHAMSSSPWFRFPYPLQWGTPVFEWKMALLMCVVSIISSVDSVGSYHASSLLVASRPPTPGVLSRGIGLEGLSSVLAGLWGTGTGCTTLTENVHTLAVTKMGSRRAVELGAVVLILLSLIGKVGGFIASIPQVMVAALLCYMWAMLTALGLSNLRYSEAGSSRNIIIVGLSLYFSLSVPAYFQQYGISPNSNSSVPNYFQPYIVASHGPIHTKFGGLNYFLNTLLSFHMVIAFIMAVILDNTVPGSQQERGVYVWSDSETARREPAVTKDYELPFRVGRLFRWVKWVGM
ncbi:Nucleobase-ascorbate transporter 12 [Linum perenne]